MECKAKEADKVLPSPKSKHGCGLPLTAVDLTKDYCGLDDVISHIKPGMKDFVSVTRWQSDSCPKEATFK